MRSRLFSVLNSHPMKLMQEKPIHLYRQKLRTRQAKELRRRNIEDRGKIVRRLLHQKEEADDEYRRHGDKAISSGQ